MHTKNNIQFILIHAQNAEERGIDTPIIKATFEEAVEEMVEQFKQVLKADGIDEEYLDEYYSETHICLEQGIAWTSENGDHDWHIFPINMTPRDITTPVDKIIKAVRYALYDCGYASDNIDVVINEVTGMLDVMYCSRNNSFGVVTNVVAADSVDLDAAAAELDKLNVCHVW